MGPIVGVDIGQKRDPTAICVAREDKRIEQDVGEVTHYLVHLLERLPLGTPYPRVVDRVAEVVHRASERTGQTVHVYVDATGVGQPVVDLLQERSVEATPVYFTYGDRRTEEGDKVTLGKSFLVSRLQTLLQTRRIHLPNTSEARVLADELQNYEIRVDENANDRYGAFRVGTHDDLVTALGLAVQPTKQKRSPLWGTRNRPRRARRYRC